MRGRLIQQFTARVVQLDRATMRSGDHYDDDFREPKLRTDPSRDNVGEMDRIELAPVLVPCQIDPETTADGVRMLAGGHGPIQRIGLLFHFRDLESLGLVDVNGNAVFRQGDRLDAILSKDQSRVEYTAPTPPGLYVASVNPRGWGLFRRAPSRNLLFVEFLDRMPATVRFE